MRRPEHNKKDLRTRRHRRVRARVIGTSERPRLAVFRSNLFVEAQIIDDSKGQTLVAATDRGLAEPKKKVDRATAVGTLIAEKAKAANITHVVFDRGGYAFHGRVKALAEAARAAGLLF